MKSTLFSLFRFFLCDNLLLQKNTQSLCENTVFLCVNLIDPSLNNTTNTSDYWHSIAIVHVPAKSPFSYSQICVYIDGVLKKETDLKLPSFSDAFNNIRVAASCARPVGQSTFSNVSSTLAAPLNNLKSVFNMSYKGSVTEKVREFLVV